jgi:CHAT domain-containing protein
MEAGGAGAEAVLGLGLAFFYAGSRTLLVSNWPVGIVSARILTTELFKREATSPGIAHRRAPPSDAVSDRRAG